MRPYLLIASLWLATLATATAQPDAKKAGPRKAQIYSSLPSGYSRVANTQLYRKLVASSLNDVSCTNYDVIGQFGTKYYSSTYNDRGYYAAMKVGSNSAIYLKQNTTTTSGTVTATTSIEQQGTMARISYTLRNTGSSAVTVSAGVYADVKIGNNDHAPLERRRTPNGAVYGITMKNGDGSQLCALFGGDMVGVTAADDYWFGHYNQNRTDAAIVGAYAQGNNWMEENGTYDSGMGWCWKNRTIRAGATLTLSWIICVGEVNLVPKATFSLKSVKNDNWNYYDRSHPFHVEGNYESPAGLNGYIEYMTDNSGVWQRCGGAIASGSNFTYDFNATFSEEALTHTLTIRTCDVVGNATELKTLTWPDIKQYTLSGIADKTYTGHAQTQTALTCNAPSGGWTVGNYANNIHAGEATFDLLGVYDKTMGHSTYTFTIEPAPLPSEVTVRGGPDYTYTGQEICPEIRFYFNGTYLEEGRDYVVAYSDNVEVGTAYIAVMGMGDFYGIGYIEFRIVPDMIPGDANDDGVVNILDPQWTLRYIHAPAQTTPFNFKNANTYTADQLINVQDIVCTVNILLATPAAAPSAAAPSAAASSAAAPSVAAPSTAAPRAAVPSVAAPSVAAPSVAAPSAAAPSVGVSDGFAGGATPAATLSATPGAIILTAPAAAPVAAIDITLDGIAPEQLSLALPMSDYLLATRATPGGGTRLAIVALTQQPLVAPGETRPILFTSTLATPTAALAATPEAQPLAIGLDEATAIAAVPDAFPPSAAVPGAFPPGPAASQPAYDLSGQRLARPRQGISIIGGRKLVIK